jgi:hypothetical protein
VVYFEIALMSTITGYLGNYANASFSTSQLLSVSSVMSSIIGGVLRLPTAKIIDIWGRAFRPTLLLQSSTTLDTMACTMS